MFDTMQRHLRDRLDGIRGAGLYKYERIIDSPQGSHVRIADGRQVINLCANNYLGLAQHPRVVAAAAAALDKWGYGLASVRFICGTQSIHKQLEDCLSDFLGMEDTILYPSCFDANGGLFETLLDREDAVISDELNHASIIDGVRLCKAKRFRYKNNDMEDLRRQLQAARDQGARHVMVTTDGVFSMDGYLTQLDRICDLADEFEALVHFDDSHAVGFVGPGGRGTHAHFECMDRVDVTTGTLGKALGGASGGYTGGRREIVDLLRQRSRPYLFSNTVAPPVVAGAMEAISILRDSTELRDKLVENTVFFRAELAAHKFDILPGSHPIVPIMLYDATRAAEFAERMLDKGVYVVAFSYPVVPEGRARIRTQVSAAHTTGELRQVIQALIETREELGVG